MDNFTNRGNANNGGQQASILRYVVSGLVLLIIAFLAFQWYMSRKYDGNNGPFKFDDKKYQYMLEGVKVNPYTLGSYTLTHYVYISGVQEQRGNPQSLWRWGLDYPLRNIHPVINALYIPAQEQILFEFECAPSGDRSSKASLYVPNITLNRWFFIAITVEGRTLDIYLNGTHAKSTQLPNVLKGTTDGIQMVGNSGVLGSMAIWKVFKGRMNESQIKDEFKSSSDTLGSPLLPLDFSKYLTLNNIFPVDKFCPGLPFCPEVKEDCKTYVNYEFA